MPELETGSRASLAADLGRAGFVRGSFVVAGGAEEGLYFDKYLVLTRPGLLDRCARLLVERLPSECDRVAARGAGAIVLATAIALQSDLPLVVPRASAARDWAFGGELFPGARVVLVEDVVLTGHSAVESIRELRDAGIDVAAMVCLLDRERSGRARIEADGVPVRALFTEGELLT